MQIITKSTLQPEPDRAVDELLSALPEGAAPGLAILSGNYTQFDKYALAKLSDRCPTLLAGSSCLGVMTQTGMAQGEERGLGLFALYDDDGAYGIGSAPVDEDPRQAGYAALASALSDVNRAWETPDLVWCIMPPGNEEEVVAGMVDLIGASVPIIGGSVADNQISGDWVQYIDGELYQDRVVVAALFPSGSIGYSFSSGYMPDERSAVVTRAEGRHLLELDGEPAADVYNRWTQGVLDGVAPGSSILMYSTVNPLGRLVNVAGGYSEYLLSHPAELSATRGLQLFTEIKKGERLYLMQGSMDSLISRAGRVADTARQLLEEGHHPVGALLVYCAGCMLTVADRMPEVVKSINEEFRYPYLGSFTFGEQGCFLDRTNRHGNLMISAVVFGADEYGNN
ncbi:FIST N-terminal domain-containing protein [Pontibacterium granulatum]|uniref:FIST signal transduction protein n=1 Tax=Pontibacterium granulatum TaxID=2036029 RepID=UPI00249B3EB3|nr:FIST N-terminal domain-containing protein [Pontibacterium granulatum]MDI3324942.1 FIST N-terminal domain-containing protein [Pontibacterium granulatum]